MRSSLGVWVAVMLTFTVGAGATTTDGAALFCDTKTPIVRTARVAKLINNDIIRTVDLHA